MNEDRYEIMPLIEGSDFKYKIRKTYSGAIGAQLRAKLIETARGVLASEITEGTRESREIRISDDDAWRWLQAKLFYLDTSGDVPIYRYRDYIPPELLAPIISVLIKPVGTAPNLLTMLDDISEEGMAAIQIFFMLCFEKRATTETEPPKSGDDTDNSGTDAKTSSTETVTSESAANP